MSRADMNLKVLWEHEDASYHLALVQVDGELYLDYKDDFCDVYKKLPVNFPLAEGL